ncbi:GNAT family N-acetyltransferase [Reyranella sp.]|uniref:GNAT family N-acetyltransferase n=1 Tax=Reyranella sp. TaxID=1929291 RepID=UPI003C7E2210
MTFEIREATEADADQGCEVMKRSIRELCIADHQHKAGILDRWLANKHPDVFRGWLRQPGNSLMVAVEHGAVLAVGAVTDGGEITLNYVSPDARFRGISRALLASLERRAVEQGNAISRLTSTATARRFYLANGYEEAGPPRHNFGTTSGFPMRKMLK